MIEPKPLATAPAEETVVGTSLWKDAWSRLRRNHLAIFGMVVVSIVIAASIIGPPIIRGLTGYTYDSIPADSALIKSFPPFTAPDGSFSWAHPMGTDIAGRDILARVLLGGRISLMSASSRRWCRSSSASRSAPRPAIWAAKSTK